MSEGHLDEETLATLALEPARADADALAHVAGCPECAAEVQDAVRGMSLLEPVLEARALALGDAAHARALRHERERRRVAIVTLVGACLGACALVISRWLGLQAPLPSVAHSAFACASTEAIGGGVAIAVVVAAARSRFTHLDALTGSAAGALGATAMQLYIHVRCPEHALVHLFFGHLATVAMVAIAGALVAPRATRVLTT